MRRNLIGLERWLWIAGGLCLGYWGFVTAEAWAFNAIHRIDWTARRPATIGFVSPPSPGEVIGRVAIPEVGIDAVLVEGVEPGDLRHAAGHLPGTALPGERGNCVIAAHRDTFFRGLREIRPGQTIRLLSQVGPVDYRVRNHFIVSPQETRLLEPTEGHVLTLVTCYPFNFIGDAPQRFIVVADRLASEESNASTGIDQGWPSSSIRRSAVTGRP